MYAVITGIKNRFSAFKPEIYAYKFMDNRHFSILAKFSDFGFWPKFDPGKKLNISIFFKNFEKIS